MRILKHAILGFLDKGQMSGYDITAQFRDAEIGEFWSAKHSQIYPELKKLLDEGLIEYHIEIQGTKLEKKVYSITEKGKEELVNWLIKKQDEITTPRDEFMLKAYFVSSSSKEDAIRQFENELNLHKVKLKYLEEKYQVFISDRDSINYESDDFGHYLVLTRAIEREKAYIKWMEKSLLIF